MQDWALLRRNDADYSMTSTANKGFNGTVLTLNFLIFQTNNYYIMPNRNQGFSEPRPG